MYDRLFSPVTIRGLELKNRVVLPAMGTRMAGEKGEITPRLVAYHAARAAGGCGLNIVEVAAVHTPSAPAHFVSISDDSLIEGHKKLTDAIHQNGGKAAIQLWQGSIATTFDPRAEMLVVNDMEFAGKKLTAITPEGIREIVECYKHAAARCVEAGYDCIEFHCAHNYLPHSFLSGGLNHRTDEYGGSFENRSRFPLECIRAIRSAIPGDMPLFMRIDAHDDYLPGGLTIEEVIEFCRIAGENGVDVLDVSRGNIITAGSVYEVPPIDIPRGFNVENAARIRRETKMVTIAVGRINTAEQAEEILEADKADLIVMGRAQLADPEFCNKAKEGRTEDIIHCVGCNQGCYDGFCDLRNRPFITCLRNPCLGHEEEWKLTKAETSKRVYIAGGGMAGLEAARVLHERGHQPVIFEAGDRLGGQFITAGQAPGKAEMKQAAVSFGRLVERSGVEVRCHTPLTAELIQEEKPDAVIAAIGSAPVALKLPGSEKKMVCQANAVLEHEIEPEGDVCVIGGGLVGLETADALAAAGHAVKVLEMKEKAGEDLGMLRKIAVMQKLGGEGVEIITSALCFEIDESGVVVDTPEGKRTVACDSVVLAVGSVSRDSSALREACESAGIEFTVIGDAKQARRAIDAVAEGFEAARSL